VSTSTFRPRATSEGEVPARPDFSNWGRWGDDDEAGAANHLTPARMLAALALPRTGQVIHLGQLIGDPKAPRTKAPAVHLMHMDGGDYLAGAPALSGFQTAGDYLALDVHGATTHIDAIGHAWYGDRLYNGYPQTVARSNGLRKLGIDKTPPLITRGVLIDLPRVLGVDRLEPGHEVTAAEIKRCLTAEGVELAAGDAVLLRTGWITAWQDDSVQYHGDRPGIGLDASQFLARQDIALAGADNSGVEVIPWARGTVCPVHQFLLRDCGICLLEFLDLEELAARRTPTFLFIAVPLRLRGGTGSPISPIAVL
jgi:kynurenine formamidase